MIASVWLMHLNDMKDFGQIPIGSEHLCTLFVHKEQSTWVGKSGYSRTTVWFVTDMVKGAVKNNTISSKTALCVASMSHLSTWPSTVWNVRFIWLSRVKAIAHWVWNFCMRFSVFFFSFIFVILSYQNACYGCENAENRTWSEFFYDGRKFQRQCVNVIDTTWGHIYFSTCENFRLGVQWPLVISII